MWDAVRFARHKGHSLPGPRQRGELGGRVLSRHHGGRSGEARAAVRALSLRGARRRHSTEAPDIDVDFEHDRREEVLDYMYENYDRAHAAITAVTQMYPRAQRGAGRDARARLSGRAGVRDLEARALVAIRAGCATTFAKSSREARARHRATRGARRCSRRCAAFEGLPRLRSTHVGGFVLSSHRSATICPSSTRRWAARSSSSTRTISTTIGVPEVRLPRARRAVDGAARVRHDRGAHRARGRRCTSCRPTTRRRTI